MKLAKLATLLLAPLFLASVAFAAPMTVSAASNNVTVVVNGKATALKAGATIPVGATIKVAKGASARIILPDGTTVGLGEGATFSLKSSEEKDGVTATVAALTRGTATVQANLKKGSELVVNTPSGTVSGIKGTVMITATSSTMTVTSTTGRWRVTGTNGKASVLAPSQTVLLTKENPKPAPRPATKAEKAQASQVLGSGENASVSATVAPDMQPDAFGDDVSVDGVDLNTTVNSEVGENSPSL